MTHPYKNTQPLSCLHQDPCLYTFCVCIKESNGQETCVTFQVANVRNVWCGTGAISLPIFNVITSSGQQVSGAYPKTPIQEENGVISYTLDLVLANNVRRSYIVILNDQLQCPTILPIQAYDEDELEELNSLYGDHVGNIMGKHNLRIARLQAQYGHLCPNENLFFCPQDNYFNSVSAPRPNFCL